MAGQLRSGVPTPLLPHPPAPQKYVVAWISQLPDDIIIHILSLLPTTKHRARTCILSRRWRHLWTHCPALDLFWDVYGEKRVSVTIYCRSVDRCFQACRAATLTRFSADVFPLELFKEGGDVLDRDEVRRRADRWVQLAAGRSVQELSLRFYSTFKALETPLSVLACGGSLTTLRLQHCDFTNFPCKAGGFPYLRTLQLHFAILPHEKVRPLLSMCPLLESLCLSHCHGLRSAEVSVSSSVNPNLKDLKISGELRVVIDVPDLRSFQLDGEIIFLSWNGPPSRRLREAGLRSAYWGDPWRGTRSWKKVMSAISDVEILSLNRWFFKFMAMEGGGDGEIVFRNLKEFAWEEYSITESSLSTFFSFVQRCPHLEKLYVNMITLSHLRGMDISIDKEGMFSVVGEEGMYPVVGAQPPGHGSPPPRHEHAGEEGPLDEAAAGKRMLARLKLATVFNFSTRRRYDMRLVELLLQEAGVLERLLLNFSAEQGMDEGAITEQVCRLPRASPAAKIIVSEMEPWRCFSRMDGTDEILSWKHGVYSREFSMRSHRDLARHIRETRILRERERETETERV